MKILILRFYDMLRIINNIRKVRPNREEIIDAWLKYHGTNVNGLFKRHDLKTLKDPSWFKLYPVTQKQYDRWELWAKKYIKKHTNMPEALIEKSWGFTSLDCAPYVKHENIDNYDT